jgi:TonB family protein
MGAEGMIRLRVLILETGDVGRIEIVESANPLLVDAAITALRQSEFSPAKKAGQPCCGTLVIPFVFGGEESWTDELRSIDVGSTGRPAGEAPLTGKPPTSPKEDISAVK